MPIDIRTLQFCVAKGPYRQPDGAFSFQMVVFNPSSVVGAPAEVVATAEVWMKGRNVGLGLAEALRQLSDQLPPDIEVPTGFNN